MEFYLVNYDDNNGNVGNKSPIIDFFNNNNFKCKAGYWGCPWYFVNIKEKIYYPGRPGVEYGKVIKKITFIDLQSLINK